MTNQSSNTRLKHSNPPRNCPLQPGKCQALVYNAVDHIWAQCNSRMRTGQYCGKHKAKAADEE